MARIDWVSLAFTASYRSSAASPGVAKVFSLPCCATEGKTHKENERTIAAKRSAVNGHEIAAGMGLQVFWKRLHCIVRVACALFLAAAPAPGVRLRPRSSGAIFRPGCWRRFWRKTLLATGAIHPGVPSWAVVAKGAAVIPSILLLPKSSCRLVLGLQIAGTALILIEPGAILLVEGGLAGRADPIALRQILTIALCEVLAIALSKILTIAGVVELRLIVFLIEIRSVDVVIAGGIIEIVGAIVVGI